MNQIVMKKEENKLKFIEKSKLIHGDKYDYSKIEYTNARTKVLIICPIHGDYEQTPDAHSIGKGCKKCAWYNSSILYSKTKERFVEQANIIHNHKYDYSSVVYTNDISKIIIICTQHGEFIQTPSHHLFSKSGCIRCNYSHGEKLVESHLIHTKISYTTQKKFSDCVNKRSLSFDFWLESHNTLIEFDGEQHHIPVELFGGLANLRYIQMCDKIKDEYCIKNSIRLLRISYKEKNNIPNIIDNYLS